MICFVTSDMRETCKFSKFLLHETVVTANKSPKERTKTKGALFCLGRGQKNQAQNSSQREREGEREAERHHQEHIFFFSAERETKIEKKKIAELEIS